VALKAKIYCRQNTDNKKFNWFIQWSNSSNNKRARACVGL